MKSNKQFLLPMILSIILLPCFVAYFLHSEYEKEKEAIRLEAKDASFNKFFAELDTMTRKSRDVDGDSLIVLRRDDKENDVKFEFRIHSQVQELSIDSLMERDTSFKVDFLDEADAFASIERKGVDTIITIESGFFLEGESPSLSHQSKTGAFPILLNKQKEVRPLEVVMRMYPQILFSLFLLTSVFLAFWFTARSLRKERQLALLRNSFMSNMSHELKTPVSTIGVALEALSTFDAADNPELRKEYIEISKNEVERLGLLVDKAMNISLYEQGRFVFDRQNINLHEAIEKVLKTLKVQLDNQNVELDYKHKGNDFAVNVDRTHMVNVVYNLIENGIKYSAKNAEISIVLEEMKDHLKLSISDNGIGIPPEFQDKVFDKFFRVPQGDTHNVKGHGLGLSYVKEVIDSLDGQISLRSGLNTGSTFIIKLPKAHD